MSEEASPRARGRRLGIDVGDARVGLASSDLDGMIATPVETLDRATAVAGIIEHSTQMDARVMMVGLPRRLDGGEGPAAQKARDFCDELVAALSAAEQQVEVRLVDERLTTVDAHRALHSSGRKGRKHRSVVDQVAAVMILQNALDAERATGRRTGELVSAVIGGLPAAGDETGAPSPNPEEQR